MKITRKQLRQIIKEELDSSTESGSQVAATLSEAIMVSLKPITSHPSTTSTPESRWAKLSGIPEEHINLSETIADTGLFDTAIKNAARQISDQFGESMMRLFSEDPEMFQGRSTEEQWQQQVTYAQQELDTGLEDAINEKIQEVETRLHDGQFHDGRDEMGNSDDNYPKNLGYKHPETGENVMISVESSDDMDDILDPLLRQYPNLPYSVD